MDEEDQGADLLKGRIDNQKGAALHASKMINILDAGMHNGIELPYSCKACVCSTCKCKLVKGKVDMDISHGLEDQEIEAGYILSCQAHPISDEVVVDFDQRN